MYLTANHCFQRIYVKYSKTSIARFFLIITNCVKNFCKKSDKKVGMVCGIMEFSGKSIRPLAKPIFPKDFCDNEVGESHNEVDGVITK